MAVNQIDGAQLQAIAQAHHEPATLIARRLQALTALATAPQPRMQRFQFADWPLSVAPLVFKPVIQN